MILPYKIIDIEKRNLAKTNLVEKTDVIQLNLELQIPKTTK